MISSFQGAYRFLSNFWPVVIVFDGQQYMSVEHAYVAAKTTDELQRERVRACTTAGEAKRVGRQVSLRTDWDRMKLHIMEQLIRQKFEHPELRQQLLDTGTEMLVEGNTWNDTFWGVCRGVGKNNLGKILMKVRAELESTNDWSSRATNP